MAEKRGRAENLKSFTPGDPRTPKPGFMKGVSKKQPSRFIEKAFKYQTPKKLRAQILRSTGQKVITYHEAILAVLVAQAAMGSARHIEILFKLNGDFARAEAKAKREVEREGDDGVETGSTLLIKVVRNTDVTHTARAPEIDVTPEENNDAVTS